MQLSLVPLCFLRRQATVRISPRPFWPLTPWLPSEFQLCAHVHEDDNGKDPTGAQDPSRVQLALRCQPRSALEQKLYDGCVSDNPAGKPFINSMFIHIAIHLNVS